MQWRNRKKKRLYSRQASCWSSNHGTTRLCPYGSALAYAQRWDLTGRVRLWADSSSFWMNMNGNFDMKGSVLTREYLDPMHWQVNKSVLLSTYSLLQAASGFMFGASFFLRHFFSNSKRFPFFFSRIFSSGLNISHKYTFLSIIQINFQSLSFADRSRPQRVLLIGMGGGSTSNYLATMPLNVNNRQYGNTWESKFLEFYLQTIAIILESRSSTLRNDSFYFVKLTGRYDAKIFSYRSTSSSWSRPCTMSRDDSLISLRTSGCECGSRTVRNSWNERLLRASQIIPAPLFGAINDWASSIYTPETGRRENIEQHSKTGNSHSRSRLRCDFAWCVRQLCHRPDFVPDSRLSRSGRDREPEQGQFRNKKNQKFDENVAAPGLNGHIGRGYAHTERPWEPGKAGTKNRLK